MANTKISELTAAEALDGTEELPIVQEGVTVKTTAQDIADLAGGGADDWASVRAIIANMMSQLAMTHLQCADGWIDSIIDATGVDELNSIAIVSSSGATGTAAEIATPTMTSNTAPSGECSASSIATAGYPAWEAFNRTTVDYEDAWLSAVATIDPNDSATWPWLKYRWATARYITSYKITPRNWETNLWPKTWYLQGSNNNTDWTELDYRVDQSFTQTEVKEYTVTSPGSYTDYRIIIKVPGAGTNQVAIGRLDYRTSALAMVLTSKSVTTPEAATEYLVVLAVTKDANYTVQLNLGDGFETLTMTRVPMSATMDQLVGTYEGSGTSAVVKVTAAAAATGCFGWSLGWR